MPVSQFDLKSLLHYDPKTGIFTWNNTLKTKVSGKQAGSLSKDGIVIGINRGTFRAHRLAFIYMTGAAPSQVDHINLDKKDNR